MPLSYSQLSTYKRCPRQYEFEYVKEVFRPMSRGESFGASIHNALKRWGELEMKHGKPQSPKKGSLKGQLELFTEVVTDHHLDQLTLTTLLTLWRAAFIGEGYDSRMEIDMKLRQGEAALTQFFQWWQAKPRTVIGIEKSFKLEIPGRHAPIILSGRIDRIERAAGGLRIIDYKSSQPRPQPEVDADLQLSVYALAAKQLWDEPVCELTLLFVTEEGMVERTTARNDSQLKDAAKIMTMLTERIESRDWKPTPSVAVCHNCPFREICDARAV